MEQHACGWWRGEEGKEMKGGGDEREKRSGEGVDKINRRNRKRQASIRRGDGEREKRTRERWWREREKDEREKKRRYDGEEEKDVVITTV
jgi:hypothetical protein